MEFTPTSIDGPLVIRPLVLGDSRGFFMECFRENAFAGQGIKDRFVQDNCSFSKGGVVRGLHYQVIQPQAKLITVMQGHVLDVIVDIRRGSPTFGQHVAVELSDRNKEILYVPIGFAHGFAVLSESALFHYKCSDYYSREGERGVRWDDSDLAIDWGIHEPTISLRDGGLPRLKDVLEEDLLDFQPGAAR
jgi:dTDP-4-dehydrorhamnose 3,5-epimerase